MGLLGIFRAAHARIPQREMRLGEGMYDDRSPRMQQVGRSADRMSVEMT